MCKIIEAFDIYDDIKSQEYELGEHFISKDEHDKSYNGFVAQIKWLDDAIESLRSENESLKSQLSERIPKSAIYKIMGNLRSIMDGQEFANIKFCIENEIENYKEEK